jgi:hypothetical protein
MVGQRVSFRDYVRGFSKPFWAANISELFERIAFYGMAPVLVPYLVEVRHFDESAAIRVGGNLGFIVYGLTILQFRRGRRGAHFGRIRRFDHQARDHRDGPAHL